MAKNMKLEIANWNHLPKLNTFFESFAFSNLIDFKIQRPRGFFAPYQSLGYDYICYLLSDFSDQILATATFICPEFKNYDLNHNYKTAIATDLRVLPNRQATLGWHQNFIPALEQIKESRTPDIILSLLSHTDRKVLNTFLRSQPYRRQVPRYYLNQSFKLTTVHGFLPFSSVKLARIQIRTAREKDWDLIQSFLLSQKWDFLSPIQRVADLQSVIQNLGLTVNSIILAQSEVTGDILGFILLVPATRIQNYIPLDYSLRAHNFRQFLKFGRFFGWTHTLTKPFSRTQKAEPLHFYHVGCIRTLHPDIFQLILQEVWKTHLKSDEFLVYLRDTNDLSLNLSSGCVTSEIEYDLFSIALPNESLNSIFLIQDQIPFRLDSFIFF